MQWVGIGKHTHTHTHIFIFFAIKKQFLNVMPLKVTFVFTTSSFLRVTLVMCCNRNVVQWKIHDNLVTQPEQVGDRQSGAVHATTCATKFENNSLQHNVGERSLRMGELQLLFFFYFFASHITAGRCGWGITAMSVHLSHLPASDTNTSQKPAPWPRKLLTRLRFF